MSLEAIVRESKVCDRLQVKSYAEKIKPLIESVKHPPLRPPIEKELKLKEYSPEFKLRLKYLEEFFTRHDFSKKFKARDKAAEIHEKFETFLDHKTSLVTDNELKEEYQPFDHPEEENDFVHKARLEGVVLRTSQHYVSLITLDGSEELLLNVDREFVGLGIKVRTGDVISVVNPKSTSKQGCHLDPELKWCYKVYPHEINCFLEKLIAKKDACTLLEDFLRSFGVWKYVLNVYYVKEEEQQQHETCTKILELCQKIINISSNSTMGGTIRNFWRSFEDSKFFNDVLPTLVQDEAWQEGNIQLVKNFLENLLKHLPECGVRALEIVKNLNIQSTAMEFMTKLVLILALNVSGVKDNPKHLKWSQQPIIPVSSELLTTATGWKDLPCVKVADKKNKSSAEYMYKSEEEYIMTYYTLMREECFHKLKNGIRHFLATGKCEPKDIMMYRVHLVKAVSNINQSIQEGLSLLFEFKKTKNDESDDPDNSNWLMFGNLLCLSFDGTFQCPVWGVISGDKEDTKDGKTQVQVSLCSERNKLNVAQVITKLQQLEDQGFPAYMVESNTFYRAYGPPLEVLQQTETVPFKEQLVKVQKCTDQPPEYLKELKKCPDWSIIFRNPSCIKLHDNDDDYNYKLLIKEFMELRGNPESQPKLDEKQLDAVEQALRNKLTLIQGPPGTGKSYVGEALLELLLSMEVPEDNGPILVVTYKNHALDNFLQTCAGKIPGFLDNLVRVGKGSDDVSDELKKRKMFELLKNSYRDNYWKTSQRLKEQLEAMKPEIDKCVKSLRCSNKFTVSTFIKEADDKHILYLSAKPEYNARIKEILNDKNFRFKHFRKLCKMIEEPLKEWLPNKEEFEKFAGKVTAEDLQSCVDEHYGMVRQESIETQEDTKDEQCDARQSLPSEEREERLADCSDEQEEEDKNDDDETMAFPEEKPLIVLPEIPDEKLGNVKAILNAGDIQQLNLCEKIQMVYALQRERYKTVTNEFLELTQDFTQKQQRRKEVNEQRKIKIIQQQNVIGMTVSGAAIRASWLESIKPSVMIVEEAAEILESQLVAVIPSSVQHLVMIGDHQQLRPQVHYDVLCRKCNFDISMFERLIKGGLDYAQLNQQGRMTDDIAELVRKLGIYDEYKTRDSKKDGQSNKGLDCLSKSMFFYDHNRVERMLHGSHSMYNEHEADVIVKMAKYLVCDNDVKTGRITILCSYRGQVHHLKKKLEKEEAYRLSDITVTTIDSFQGKENDIILLSLVRSNTGPKAKIGYLSSINRICVAVSRARIGLYLFGNTHLLKKKSLRGWGRIINHMSEKNLVGKKIEMLIGDAADGHSPGPAGAKPQKQSGDQSPVNITIQNPKNVIIGDNNIINLDNHQGDGRPQQQSTPTRPPQDDQHSQEGQPVEETSKHHTQQQSTPTRPPQDDQHSQEGQPMEETSKHHTPPTTAGGNQDSSPFEEEREGQELSWTGDPHLFNIDETDRYNLPSAEESEAQEMSWTDVIPNLPYAEERDQVQQLSSTGDGGGDVVPQPSVIETQLGSSLQETGDIDKCRPEQESHLPKGQEQEEKEETGEIAKHRPVQDSHLPKGQEQEEKEEDDKVQPVEEESKDKKGQLVVGVQSDVSSLSDDVKASGEDASSPQQDSNLPPVKKKEDDKVQPVEEGSKDKKGQLVIGVQSDVSSLSDDVKASSGDASSPQQDLNFPQNENREVKIFDDIEACILRKCLQEAPGAADLISKLQNLKVNNPQSIEGIDLDNQELTIGEIVEKVQLEIVDQYLEEQGCNCDECCSLR